MVLFLLSLQWDLVCDNAARSELAQTMIMMGQGLGAAIFSPLSDRFGRKPINILARVLYIIAGVTAMFSPSIAVFSVYRLLIGTFQQVCSGILVNLILLICLFVNYFCNGYSIMLIQSRC